jgi:hypothetical protein
MASYEEFKKKYSLNTSAPANTVPQQSFDDFKQKYFSTYEPISQTPKTTQAVQPIPTFKTLEEAQAYAKNNNINVANAGVKIPTLAQNVPQINIQTAIGNGIAKPNATVQTLKNIATGATSTGANILEHVQDYNSVTGWQDTLAGLRAQTDEMLANKSKGRSFAESYTAGKDKSESVKEERKQQRYEDTDKVTQALKDARQQAIEDTNKLTGFGKAVAEGGMVVGDMLPTIAAGIAGGPLASRATLFMNAKQNAYNQAIENGATHDQAYWNSMLKGTGELAIESLSGGAFNKLAKVPGVANVSKLTQGIKSPLVRGGLNLVGDVVGEGAEEVVSTLVDPIVDRITYNPEASTASLQEVWDSFTSSIIPTIMFGGINAGTTFIQNGVNKIVNKQKTEIEKAQIPQEQKEILKKQVDEMAKVAEEEISAKTQKNIAPESAQTQEMTATNKVIPQEGVNANIANVVQNTANAQNVAQNEANLTQKAIDLVQNSRISQSDKKSLIDTIKNMQVTEASFENLQNLIQTAESEIPQPYVNKTKLEQQKYAQYKNNPAKYDASFNEILEANPANKQGKRTKQQWLKVAEDFGKRLQGKTAEEIELNQYKTWQAVRPNTKDSLNRYGSAKQGDGTAKYVSFTLDEWKDAIARGAQQTDAENAQNKNYVNNQQENIALPTAAQLNQQSQEMIEGAQALTLEEPKKRENTGFMLVNPEDSYKRNVITNNAKAMNDLIKAKRIVSDDFDAQIKKKQDLLNSKKDKTTKVAQTLQNQIINLQNRKANAEEKFLKQIDRLKDKNEKMKKQVADDRLPTRKEIKQDIITQTDMENINLDNAKDLSKFIMNNTTPLRVNEKVFDRETATKINDTFFRPIKTNEAERIRFLNKERSEIEALDIAPNSKESEYVQIYGEGEWVNPDTGEATAYTLKDLKKDFPEDWEKIKAAAEKIREKYDTYLDAVNKELNKMGYDSIPKLKNYFRHFEATTSLLDQIGIPSKADHLPTDMNGLTSDLRPGKNFFANALSRTGKKTTYDAITGIDGYLEGVSKLMYHTEDIQKLRTFDEYIRNKYGQNAELEGLNKKEFQEKVEQIQEGHLSEYAAWLSEYTNALAGKKSKMDRGTEEALGRRIYGTLNAVKKQVGSNLTGLNLNSALSNFISITQAGSKTSKYAMLEGFGDTVKNIFEDDGFINKSDFLTRRFGSDKLSKTAWEKASNAGQIFMAGTDYFSANLITRSKYHEYLNKGYPEAEAMRLADEFADRLMGGRALGDMPNIFNSKTLGILTQFQLENVNQFDSMFHDTKYKDRATEQTKYEAKTWNEKFKSKLAKEKPEFYNSLSATLILGQLFAYAWAYNKIDEELTGSGGAFDPIGIIEDLIKDFINPNLTKGQAVANLAKNIIDVIPYANIITGGGRVPMTDAIPNIVDLLEGESSIGSEAWKLLNLALPTGGGQLRKTAQAAGALIKGGDYKTNSNGEKQLKFPIAQEGDIGQRIAEGAQALLFGKWATPGGQKYIEDGFKPLSAIETKGLEKAQEMDITIKEFYDIMEAIENIEVPKRKNKKGKEEAVPGARKKLVKEELDSRKELTTEQKKLLYDIFYSKEL